MLGCESRLVTVNPSGELRIYRRTSQVGFLISIALTIWFSLIPIEYIPSGTRISDSILHFVGYAVLGFLSVASGLRPRTGFTVVFIFGIVLELIQGLFGYRYFEIKDIVINGLGAVVGVGIGYLVAVKLLTTYRYRRR